MTKKALISRLEPREMGYRVAQVEDVNKIFPVGEPGHFWVDCADNIIADKYWYDINNSIFVELPEITPDSGPSSLKKPVLSSI